MLQEKIHGAGVDQLLHDPDLLVRQGLRDVTKAILFPVRFLSTLATGRVDGNEPAVRDFAIAVGAPLGPFASAAFQWRQAGVLPEAALVIAQCRAHLRPLYHELTDQYTVALRRLNARALAEAMQAWRAQL